MSDLLLPPWLASFWPRLVPLAGNLTSVVFPLMKIYPADYCVRRAKQCGLFTERTRIVETSSGSMALALAIVGCQTGAAVTVVSDWALDARLQRRIEQLGAHVERVTSPAPQGGYQRARLDRLAEVRRANPDHWWLNQYDNPEGREAYHVVGAWLAATLGRIDCLIGAVGTGGSMCGLAASLRQRVPHLHVVGVDTFRSVLFGQPDGPRQLRGLGNSILPGNVDHTAFDEVHWVTAAEAFRATRDFHRETTLFLGGTSGAVAMVARYWARQHPSAAVACIFADDGVRYVGDLYNDRYLHENGLWLDVLPTEPVKVDRPAEAAGQWSMFAWGRRRHSDVVRPQPLTVTVS